MGKGFALMGAVLRTLQSNQIDIKIKHLLILVNFYQLLTTCDCPPSFLDELKDADDSSCI